MRSTSSIPTLVAAAVLAVVACSESTGPASPLSTSSPPTALGTTASGALAIVNERPFATKAASSTDASGAEGWATTEYSSARLTIVEDPAGPASPPRAAQMIYPAGFAGNGVPARAKIDFAEPYRTLSVELWSRLSPDWRGPTVTPWNGFYQLDLDGVRTIVFGAHGAGTGRLVPGVRLHDAPDARRFLLADDAPGVEMRRGTWQRWSLAVKLNTVGMRDGEIHLWLDGAKIGSWTDVELVESGEADRWTRLQWMPRWGGSGDVVPVEMAMLWDHIAIGGSVERIANATPPGLGPPPPTPTPVAAVVVTPDSAAVERGATLQLTATTVDADGTVLPGRAVSWSAAQPSVATVSASGLVTGVSEGVATVVATSEGQRDSARVTVTRAAVASVAVTPPSPTIVRATTLQLSATVRDARGATLADRAVAWASSDTLVATVSASGLVTGVAPGSATVSATSEGVSGAASVLVTEPPPPPPPPSGLAVVPGLAGFGTATPAGRGGRVIRVTTLNDGGPGSLREAIDATGPRVVVFEVAGTIHLQSNLRIANPYITIAGQTAPSPGITLRGVTLVVRTHDVLVQHLRVRVGDDPSGPSPDTRDGLQPLGTASRNVVFDHVSVSWGLDENIGSAYALSDITVANSIISEGLNNSLKGVAHSKGILIGDHSHRVAMIGNLLAHNYDRNIAHKGDVTSVLVNNVMYNWGNTGATQLWQDSDATGKPTFSSIVGNVYLHGPNTPSSSFPVKIRSSLEPGSAVYVRDNEWFKATSDPWSVVTLSGTFSWNPRASTPPLWPDGLVARPGASVEAWVLANAGARPADRDDVDRRIVAEVASRTGRIIDSPSQVGGWPTLAQTTRALTLPADPSGDADGDGYTNLEEWLHAMAAEVEGRAP